MDLVLQLLEANLNQSMEAVMEFRLEVWTCNPIQEAKLADKEAWKTTPHTQF